MKGKFILGLSIISALFIGLRATINAAGEIKYLAILFLFLLGVLFFLSIILPGADENISRGGRSFLRGLLSGYIQVIFFIASLLV